MLKFTQISACLLIVLAFILAMPACVAAEINCKIYTADLIDGNYTLSEGFAAEKMTDAGTSYIHLTASIASTAQYMRLELCDPALADADFKPEFTARDYPVVAIGYRTNAATTNNKLAINAGMKLNTTGNYERCWGLNTDMIANGKWNKAVIDLQTFNTYAGGSGNFTNVTTDSGIRYIRMPVWAAHSPGADLSKEYFDISYIGFFKTAADAQAYKFEASKVESYVVTFKGHDGKIVKNVAVSKGSTVAFPAAPKYGDSTFTGWVDEAGKTVADGFKPTKNTVLTATYRLSEKELKANARKEAYEKALKEGSGRTDTPFIKGYDGFLFKPDNNMTRAEACTVITRLLVDENTVKGKYTSSFTDLEKNAWYYSNIAYLESLGYLKSYSGKFEPNKNITRAEFVELVYAMGKVTPNPANKPTFSDVPATHPRYEVIMAGASAGLVSGRPGGIFDPDGTIKRSEVVKVLCAALGRTPDMESFDNVPVAGFVDINEKHWAHPYVMESAYEHKTAIDNENREIWVEVMDTNNYYSKVPDGLIDKLEAEFESKKNSILQTKSEYKVADGGTVWYVSDSEGENMYSGKSPDAPFKTLKKIERLQEDGTIKAGDVVLFKRGDEWHGKFTTAEGITYSAYGEGEKPKILGSKEADRPEQWKTTDVEGVYVFYIEMKSKEDVGNIVFNDGECYGMRVIAHNGRTLGAGDDNVTSNGINTWKFDPRPFKDYTTLAEIASDIPEADLMFWHDRDNSKLYLYSRTGNPGDRFDSIELCTYGHAINAMSNVIIDNLCIKYAGSHGISADGVANGTVENLTVRNCEIGWIGGSVQTWNDTQVVRYGNAVQAWGGTKGFYVYNNYMCGCFDCGPTVQWQGTLKDGQIMIEEDIQIYDNVLDGAPLEVWMTPHNPNTATTYAKLINCRMYNNMVKGSGYGWKAYNHQKVEYCAFYGGDISKAPYIDCYMENNYFWDNKRHVMKAATTSTLKDKGFIWRNNTIIHPNGEGSLGSLASNPETMTGTPIQYFYDEETINRLVKCGAFGVNNFYYTPGDAANRRVWLGLYN